MAAAPATLKKNVAGRCPRRYLCSTFPGLTAVWHPRWRPHTTLAEQTALLSGMEAAVTACDLDAMDVLRPLLRVSLAGQLWRGASAGKCQRPA